VYFIHDLIAEAYHGLINLDKSQGKSRKEKVSGLRYLIATTNKRFYDNTIRRDTKLHRVISRLAEGYRIIAITQSSSQRMLLETPQSLDRTRIHRYTALSL